MTEDDSFLDPKSSCIKRPTTCTKIPDCLRPLCIPTLFDHILVVFSLPDMKAGWKLPGESKGVTYTPDPVSSKLEYESDYYLNEFLDYFISVKNYIKHQNYFRTSVNVSAVVLTHILSFAWTVLTDPPLSYIENGIEKMEKQLIYVMKLIRIFSRLDTVSTKIGEKHGIKVILRCMQVRPLSKQLQINCSASLANLASVESNRKAMLDEGCIKLVLDNMNKFMTCPAVQAEVCATLANLACHEANAIYIVQNGGLNSILRAMKIHIEKVDLQTQAFHAIASLGKPGKDILEQEDFASHVMECVAKYNDNVELMSGIWHAVGLLANCGTTVSRNKDNLVNSILSTIRRFESNPTFQVTACFALAHIFFNHPVQENAVLSVDGIQAILKVMQIHASHESLQTTALFALGSIVIKSDTYRQLVLQNNGIQLILAAMKRDYSLEKKKKIPGGSVTEENELEKLDKSPILGQNSIAPAAEQRSASMGEYHSSIETEEFGAEFEEDVESSSGPEPVMYSRGNEQVKCSKPLLLQLFGSVSLANLAESASCREAIILAGGVHFIFQALQRVHDQPDLWLIVHYVFSKFTKCGAEQAVYLKPRSIPSLREYSQISILNQRLKVTGKGNADTIVEKSNEVQQPDSDDSTDNDISESSRQLLMGHRSTDNLLSLPEIPKSKSIDLTTKPRVKFDDLILPPYLKSLLEAYHTCDECGKGCYDNRIRLYKTSRSENSKISSICSWTCAKKHKTFENRPVFYYEPHSDI